MGGQSVSLLLEVGGQFLDSLVELSGVLRDSVVHFVGDVEGADDVVVLGGGNAGSSAFLSEKWGTFLR